MKRLLLTIPLLLLLSFKWPTDFTVPPSELCVRSQVAVAGDNIVVTPGEAPGGCWVSERNGNSLAPITLKAQTPGTVTIKGSTATRTSAFSLYRSSYWRLIGINFEGAANAGVWLGSNSNNLYMSMCQSRYNGIHGMLTGTSNNGLVEDCQFFGQNSGSNPQHGVYLSQLASGWIFRRCQFFKNSRGGLQLASQGAGGVIKNVRVEDCQFWSNGEGNAAAAINMLGVNNVTISGCLITGNKAGGIVVSPNGSVGGESDNVLISNCTINFQPLEGRTCVQCTGIGTTSISGCRMWTGKSNVDAILALSGATILQANNVVLAPMSVPITPSVGSN